MTGLSMFLEVNLIHPFVIWITPEICRTQRWSHNNVSILLTYDQINDWSKHRSDVLNKCLCQAQCKACSATTVCLYILCIFCVSLSSGGKEHIDAAANRTLVKL